MADRDNTQSRKLVESVLNDLKLLSTETKKKHPTIKENAEVSTTKLRSLLQKDSLQLEKDLPDCKELYQALLTGCETKLPRLAVLCLGVIQKLASVNAVVPDQVTNVVGQLKALTDNKVDDLKVLQTIIVLMTASSAVHSSDLAKVLVVCFHLSNSNDANVSNTALAAIRQIVSVVFSRVVIGENPCKGSTSSPDSLQAPSSAQRFAQDAFLFFQDLCQLCNNEPTYWLDNLNDINRVFGLELMESALKNYPKIFLECPEFIFLLKERLCPLVIRMFSPNVKHRGMSSVSSTQATIEKPIFLISARLLRIVSVLIKNFYVVLVTECEIFLSLMVKFLDLDKSVWQRVLSLEVILSFCVQPVLLRTFCQYYDLREHSSKVFLDIVIALTNFVQSSLSRENVSTSVPASPSPAAAAAPPPTTLNSGLANPDKSYQTGFTYRGYSSPYISIPATQTKAWYLEQLDVKAEFPSIPDSYALSAAVTCLLELAKSIEVLVMSGNQLAPLPFESGSFANTVVADMASFKAGLNIDPAEVCQEMINLSWNPMHSTMDILLESSSDESATDSILQCMQTYVRICGQFQMFCPRDAFVTSMCRASLPPQVNLAAISKVTTSGAATASETESVATSSPTGPITVTMKHVQCIRSLLNLTQCHGEVLGTAWYLALSALQQHSILLGLKPTATLGPKFLKAGDGINTVLSSQVVQEIPTLSSWLTRMFEASGRLDEVSLHHLVAALCRLSLEAVDQASSNKEPSFFGVSRLLEMGICNLQRIRVLWKPLTNHLLEVCQHSHYDLRDIATTALVSLLRMAFVFQYETPLHVNKTLQALLLNPLVEMSMNSYTDVRQKQYDCILQIIQDVSQNLSFSWPIILNSISMAVNQNNESVIRQAFQCIHLTVTDLASVLPPACLYQLIEVVGKFGLQPQEINISLTAVGLLWNLADFLSRHKSALSESLDQAARASCCEDNTDVVSSPPLAVISSSGWDGSISEYERVWMCLYSTLGELSVDTRPAVRKSAGQTLVSTILTHSSVLQQSSWNLLLWRVLFPLLEKVKVMLSLAADVPPPSEVSASSSILIHHSRDTVEKQWAETRVLVVSGVSRVFFSKKGTLSKLDEYPRAWALLLEHIESSALSHNAEVAFSGLKSFHEVTQDPDEAVDRTPPEPQASKSKASVAVKIPTFISLPPSELDIWLNTWRVWQNIGLVALSNAHYHISGSSTLKKSRVPLRPSQDFLTALVQSFPCLFTKVYTRFGLGDMHKLSQILVSAIECPVNSNSNLLFTLPSTKDPALTPLQLAIVTSIESLLQPVPPSDMVTVFEITPTLYPSLFGMLCSLIRLSFQLGQQKHRPASSDPSRYSDTIPVSYVAFSERCISIMVSVYRRSCACLPVLKASVLLDIIRALRVPLQLKYRCSPSSAWKGACVSLVECIRCSLPKLTESPPADPQMEATWSEFAETLEDFLFSNSQPPVEGQTQEEHLEDEKMDTMLVTLLREEILLLAPKLPRRFLERAVSILNRGSIYSVAWSGIDLQNTLELHLRDNFARACFETLLYFAFIGNPGEKTIGCDNSLARIVLFTLVDKCNDVLSRYQEDEKLNGICPLPKSRIDEVCSVLKSISCLISSLKQTHRSTPHLVEDTLWSRVFALYGLLLDCVLCINPLVRRSVRDTLGQYSDLLSCKSLCP